MRPARPDGTQFLPLIPCHIHPQVPTILPYESRMMSHCMVKYEAVQLHEITQCRNCLRIEHATCNCNLPYRRVKCNLPEEAGRKSILYELRSQHISGELPQLPNVWASPRPLDTEPSLHTKPNPISPTKPDPQAKPPQIPPSNTT